MPPNTNGILPQDHAAVCHTCAEKDDAGYLLEKKQDLKRLANGEPSNLTASMIAKYAMEYDETHGVYRHPPCGGIAVPDRNQKIFVVNCFKCGESVCTTLDHEMAKNQTVYGVASPVQKDATCPSCGYVGKKNEFNVIVGEAA